MEDFLTWVNNRNQAEYPLYHQPVIAFFPLTQTQIDHFFSILPETLLCQYLGLLVPQTWDVLKDLVVLVGCFPTPVNHLTARSAQPAQLTPAIQR